MRLIKIKESLKTVLTLNYIIVVTTPILLISIVNLSFLANNLQHQVAEKNNYISSTLVQELEEFLNHQQSVLGLVEDSFKTKDIQMDIFLNSIINNYSLFDMIQIADNNGIVKHVAPFREDYREISISGYSFYKEATKNYFYWSNVFMSLQTGQPTIAVTRKIKNGLVIGYLNLSKISDIFDRVYIGDSGWVEIVDRNGTVIFYKDKSQIYQRMNFKNRFITQQGLQGKYGEYRYKESGVLMLANVALVTQTGWPVTVCQTVEEAYRAVVMTRNVFLLGTLGTLILAILLALRNLNKIMQPLASLANWTKEVAAGNYAITFQEKTYEEFNELADYFHKMTEAIQYREQAFRDSEERYALAVIGAKDGLWDWDLVKDEFYYSPRWKEILGYSNLEIANSPSEWFDRIHPEDYERVKSDLDRHFKGYDDHFQNEHRLLHKNGSYFWVLARGIVIKDRDQKLYRMAGSLTDISERKFSEEQIKASLKEKELLLKEIHHRVKNNMQVISSLLRLQLNYMSNEKYKEMFKDSQNRIKSMALVHEKLYQSNDLTRIDFKDYVENLASSLFRSYGIDTERISLSVKVVDIMVGIDTAIPCGLIINELLSNALKYAFPDERSGVIEICIGKNPDNKIELVVRDNGVGLPEDFDLNKCESLGLQLVTVLTQDQLQGEITFERKNGTEFRLKFQEVNNG